MSKGWYVKVDVPVQFNMDCNIGVVASEEFGAIHEALKIVDAELRKTVDDLRDTIPWDFKTGALEWERGCETLDPLWDQMQAVSVTPDSDFDPDELDDPNVDDLMDAAMCLLEAFWNLPDDDHRKSDVLPNYGIAVVRSRMGSAAKLCDQVWTLVEDEDRGDCFDWDFCPLFLDRCMDEHMLLKSDDAYELKKIFEEG